MGVKDLWNILSPVCNNISINDMQGKTLAIDLSCWVCEGQFVGDKTGASNPRMYLRNVFFRTHALLMIDVKPVFVLDGKAPELKQNAMKQRTNHRFRHFRNFKAKDTDDDDAKKGGRSRFKGILKQCREMLELMGVTCMESEGEAEAFCGQLNREGLVDGVITQDSDVFCYGAKVVYRNLIIKNGTGTVDCYDMKDIEKNLKLTREKMVAMSLLCGCDYDLQGVQGVGKDIAYKYLSSFNGDVLERFRNLRTNSDLIRLEEERNGCARCCHAGKLKEHRISGCTQCRMLKSCSENFSPTAYRNLSEEEKKEVTLELNLRKKALADPTFPNQKTIDEYLCTQQTITDFDAAWKKPNICRFVNFCSRMMEWVVEYGIDKIFPMLSRWILIRAEFDDDQVAPKEILKKRMVKGVPSFELVWSITDEKLIGFLALLMDDPPQTFSSVEPQVLIAKALPQLHDEFISKTGKENQRKKKPVARKRKVKENKPAAEIPAPDSAFELPSTNSDDSYSKQNGSPEFEDNSPTEGVPFEALSPVQLPDSDSDSIVELPVTNPAVKPAKDFDISMHYRRFFPDEDEEAEIENTCDNEHSSDKNEHPSQLLNPSLESQPTYSPIVEPARKVRKSDQVDFSLGLDSFCNMTIDEESDDSDISIIVEKITSRKLFYA